MNFLVHPDAHLALSNLLQLPAAADSCHHQLLASQLM